MMDDKRFDGTDVAKAVFSSIFKTYQRFGVNYITSILAGSKSQKIIDHKHDALPSYGALKDYSFGQVKLFVLDLIEQGYLEQTKGEYPVVKLLDKGQKANAGLEKVMLKEADPELAKKILQKGESVSKTLTLFKEGKTVSQIAEERHLAQTTILSHLAESYQNGEQIDINQFVQKDRQETITEAFKKQGMEFLSPVKQTLGPSYSWEELKWVKAKLHREQAAV